MINFSIQDLGDIRGLERVFRQFQDAINAIGTTPAPLPADTLRQITTQLLPVIREGLQATGSTPLNLQALPGTTSNTTPNITSFINAQHTHETAAQGGTLNAAAIAAGTLPVARGGTGSSTAAGARANLNAAQIQSPGGPVTITLAALTGGGTQGSITINAEGVVTAYVLPT